MPNVAHQGRGGGPGGGPGGGSGRRSRCWRTGLGTDILCHARDVSYPLRLMSSLAFSGLTKMAVGALKTKTL